MPASIWTSPTPPITPLASTSSSPTSRGDATATLPSEYRKTRVTYLTAPPRVANYLDRPEALRALRDTLFAEDHRQPIALTALAGMGGIGKTVLAKALTDDEVVQRAFPDGIVWITAGKERKRDFIEEMREVAKALGDDLTGYDTALACENRYRTTIANKAALIVVDDVWSLVGHSSRSSPTRRAPAFSSPPATHRSADSSPPGSTGQTCSIISRRVSYWRHGQICPR